MISLENLTLLTDIGSYLDSNLQPVLPFEILFRAGVYNVCFKGAQEDLSRYVSTQRSIDHAKSFGVKTIGCYYWDDPTVFAKILRESYKRAIEKEKPHWFSVDIEQRKDWQGKDIDPSYLSDHAQELTEGLASDFPELLMLPYSARYMVQYAPKLALWIDQFEQWTAAWPDSPQERYRLELEQIKSGMVRQTLYDNKGNPIRYTDGSYAFKNIFIGQDGNWQAATNKKICLIRQYSSRILLPWKEVGGTQWDHQYDFNYIPLTQKEWERTIRKEQEVTTVASIHVESVLQKDRAKVIHWKPEQALKVPLADLKADAIILTAAGMDRIVNKQPTIYSEDSFKARHAMVMAENLPVIARINVHSGYWTIRQYGGPTVLAQTCQGDFSEAQKQESVRQNLVLPSILSALCDGAFSMDALFAKKLKWLDVKLLDLLMVEKIGYAGQNIGDTWHTMAWNHITKGLNWLMLRGYMPWIPIAMLTTADWLDQFPVESQFKVMMANAQSWLWLHLGQWTQFSTSTFETAEKLWETSPAETFVWTKTDLSWKVSKWQPPDGFGDKVLLHLYAELQKLAGLPSSEVELNRWQDNVVGMRGFMGTSVVTPPPPPPTGVMTLEELTLVVKDLQSWQTKIRGA